MALSLTETQDAILNYLKEEVPFDVKEHAIPDAASVPRTPDGKLVPYVALQFGDPIAQGARSFNGPMGDDYQMPIYIQVVSSTPGECRNGANRILEIFLGQDFPWSGSVRKRLGGAMFPLEGSNSGTEGYIWPLSFGVLVQLSVTP